MLLWSVLVGLSLGARALSALSSPFPLITVSLIVVPLWEAARPYKHLKLYPSRSNHWHSPYRSHKNGGRLYWCAAGGLLKLVYDGPFAFGHSGLEAHTSTLDDQASMPYIDIIQFHSQYCSWGVVATVRIPKYHQYTSGAPAQGALGVLGRTSMWTQPHITSFECYKPNHTQYIGKRP